MRTSAAFCSIHGCAVRLDTCSTSLFFVTQFVRICGHLPRSSSAKDADAARPEALLGAGRSAAGRGSFHHDAGSRAGVGRGEACEPRPRLRDTRGSPGRALSTAALFVAGTTSVEMPRLSREGILILIPPHQDFRLAARRGRQKSTRTARIDRAKCIAWVSIVNRPTGAGIRRTSACSSPVRDIQSADASGNCVEQFHAFLDREHHQRGRQRIGSGPARGTTLTAIVLSAGTRSRIEDLAVLCCDVDIDCPGAAGLVPAARNGDRPPWRPGGTPIA